MKQIAFVEPNVTKLLDVPKKEPEANEVCVKMHYTAVSAGTERANVTGDPNTDMGNKGGLKWPRVLGYSGSGIVESVGKDIDDLKPGDRVIVYWGKHQEYNTMPRKNIVKIDYDNIELKEAAFAFISQFSLAAVRKTRLEIGESCMIVGLGLLGLFGVQYAKLAGAHPVIAVDFSEERRILAQKLGADYVFDPSDENMSEQIRQVTEGKGVNTVIEVTGNPVALNTSLQCTAEFARVALLGCTRVPTTVDFYKDVHSRGITLVGAHTKARPEVESRPGFWTHEDDCKTALRFMSAGKLDVASMISEVHSPEQSPEVYHRLAFDKNFPIGVEFDWTLL